MSAVEDFFGSVGQATGDGLIGAMTNAINQAVNYKYAIKMADYNYNLSEKAADSADARRRALYEDYESPLATIRQLKEAGLSPSLYAGGELGGGIGATSGAQGGGGAGATIPSNAGNTPDLANIELMNAQADKLRAEADTLRGQNERGQGELAKIWAEAGALKAAEKLKNAETTNTELNNYVLNESKDFKVAEAKALASKHEHEATNAFYTALQEGLQFKYDKATFDERVNQVSKENALIIARTLAANTKAKLNDAEVRKLETDIQYIISKNLREWGELDVAERNANTYETWINAKVPYIGQELEIRAKELGVEKWKVGAQYFNTLINGAGMVIGAGMLKNGGMITNTPPRQKVWQVE